MQLKLRFHISFSDVNATAIWIAHLHQRQQTGVTADDFGDDFSKMVTTRHGSNRLVRLNDAFMTDQSVYSPPHTPPPLFAMCLHLSRQSLLPIIIFFPPFEFVFPAAHIAVLFSRLPRTSSPLAQWLCSYLVLSLSGFDGENAKFICVHIRRAAEMKI